MIRIALLLLFLFLPTLGLTNKIPEAEREAAVAKARVHLAAFDRALDTDEEKAEEAFVAMLAMPDFIQQGLNRHLEAKWEERSLAYRRAAGIRSSTRPSSSSGQITGDQLRKARELQKSLEEIRSLSDEDEMKKTLKTEGWPALEGLNRIYRPSSFREESREKDRPADPSTAGKRVAALKVGAFRERLRKHLGVPLPQSPKAELDGEDASEENSPEVDEQALHVSGSARAVLRKNAELARAIESSEVEGIRQLNEWRIVMGLNPLLIDPKLCDAARDHSKDMANEGFFSHTSPVEGKTSFTQRAKNFGTSARAENIAINGSPSGANSAWFHSPGHHKNMFRNHTTVGLGIHGRHYTQLFR